MNKSVLSNFNVMTVSLATTVFGLLVTWGVELLVEELFRMG